MFSLQDLIDKLQDLLLVVSFDKAWLMRLYMTPQQ